MHELPKEDAGFRAMPSAPAGRASPRAGSRLGHSATIGIALDTELERCGWKKASRIFDQACNPALPQDEFDRLMREFRNISDKWRKK